MMESFGLEKIFKNTESNCTESEVTVAGIRPELHSTEDSAEQV